MVKVKKEEITPLCPHCDKEVEELTQIDIPRGFTGGFRGNPNVLISCPHCRKILSVIFT